MKNKKGFTLVELLAVIVILGVLLLIAVPGAQNIIANFRRNSFQRSVEMVIDNVETVASMQLDTPDNCVILVQDIKANLEKGKLDVENENGFIYYLNGKANAYFYNDKYIVTAGTSSLVTVKDVAASDPKYTATLVGTDEYDLGEATDASSIEAEVPICSWYK